MGLFSKIMDKLGLGKKPEQKPTAATVAPKPITGTFTPAPPKPSAPRPAVSKPLDIEPDVKQQMSAKPAVAPISDVDVVKQLEQLAKGSGLDWKVSIVDLLKLLDIDSSREARNELAKELGCPEELMSDSAKMNTWLHKTVLKKIAENGGNIPNELLD